MTKKETIISIICFVVVIVVGFWGIATATISKNRCQSIIVKGEVLTVDYSPDSFGGFEHWSGIAIENNKEVSYMLLEPIRIGDIIISKRGCGYPKNSTYNNWVKYDL